MFAVIRKGKELCIREGSKKELNLSVANDEVLLKYFESCEAAESYKMSLDATFMGSGVIIYVDGSADDATGRFGYGCVVLNNRGNVLAELSGFGEVSEDDRVRGALASEIYSAMAAITWAMEKEIPRVVIAYDFKVVEMWAHRPPTKEYGLYKSYRELLDKARGKVAINFEKVTAHSGNTHNNKADLLARCALKQSLVSKAA